MTDISDNMTTNSEASKTAYVVCAQPDNANDQLCASLCDALAKKGYGVTKTFPGAFISTIEDDKPLPSDIIFIDASLPLEQKNIVTDRAKQAKVAVVDYTNEHSFAPERRLENVPLFEVSKNALDNETMLAHAVKEAHKAIHTNGQGFEERLAAFGLMQNNQTVKADVMHKQPPSPHLSSADEAERYKNMNLTQLVAEEANLIKR